MLLDNEVKKPEITSKRVASPPPSATKDCDKFTLIEGENVIYHNAARDGQIISSAASSITLKPAP